MDSYIVKQPINDENNEVFAYEVKYIVAGKQLSKYTDAEAAEAVGGLLLKFSSDDMLEQKKVFVTFTPNLLFRNVPQMFSPDKLIIQVDDEILLYPQAVKSIDKLRKEGYEIALKGFEFNSRYFAVIEYVDYIKINFSRDFSSLTSVIELANHFGKQIVAYGVDDQNSFNCAKQVGVRYKQGKFIGTLLPEKVKKVKHLESNFFQLMVAITRDEPNFDEIEQMISLDVTLTYELLRLANSAYFALRNKATTVHQALVVLGISQLRQWIYLLSFQRDSGIPSEFIKLSFLRANFAQELVPYAKNIGLSTGEAYILGMFSTLESLLEVSLADALEKLDISDAIKEALLHRTGRAGELYQLILCYEDGDWIGMSNSAEELDIPVNLVSQKYFECVDTVNTIWERIMSEPNRVD